MGAERETNQVTKCVGKKVEDKNKSSSNRGVSKKKTMKNKKMKNTKKKTEEKHSDIHDSGFDEIPGAANCKPVLAGIKTIM